MKFVKFSTALIIFALISVTFSTIGCRDTLKTGIRGIYDDFRSAFESGNYEKMQSMLTENSINRILKLGDGNFEAGIKAKLEQDKTFKKVMTIEGSEELDRTLGGQMSHSPYAFEKAIRQTKGIAIEIENLTKQLETAKANMTVQIQSQINQKISEYKGAIDAAVQLNGETNVKDLVINAAKDNVSSDFATLKSAIEKALEDSGIAALDNTGFIRFSLGTNSNYRWEVQKIVDKDEWKINIP